MASIRTRKGSDMMFVDFHYMGKRCREMTNLTDTPANRKNLENIILNMEAKIRLGIFNYAEFFPEIDKAEEMMALNDRKECIHVKILIARKDKLR